MEARGNGTGIDAAGTPVEQEVEVRELEQDDYRAALLDDGDVEDGLGAPAPALAPPAPAALPNQFGLVGSSPTVARLFFALARAQGKIEPAKKDSENVGFSRAGKSARYADLSAVIEAARPHLAANGLCVMQIPTVNHKGQQVLVTLLCHESGEWVESTYPIRPMKRLGKEEGGNWVESHDPQSIGSAFTYARRYAYQGVVGVTAEEDDDGNAASGRGAQKGPRLDDMPCPKCAMVGSIRESKPEYGGGWYCSTKSKPPYAKGPGCGAKFLDDPRVPLLEAKRAELAAPTGPAPTSAPTSAPAKQPIDDAIEDAIRPLVARLAKANDLDAFDKETDAIAPLAGALPEAARTVLRQRAARMRTPLAALAEQDRAAREAMAREPDPAPVGNSSLDASLEKAASEGKAPKPPKPTAAQIAQEVESHTKHLRIFERLADLDDAVKALATGSEYLAASPEVKTAVMTEIGQIRTGLTTKGKK